MLVARCVSSSLAKAVLDKMSLMASCRQSGVAFARLPVNTRSFSSMISCRSYQLSPLLDKTRAMHRRSPVAPKAVSYSEQAWAVGDNEMIGEVEWTPELANCVYVIGNTGRDVDLRYLNTGNFVANVSLAVKGKGDATDWFDIEIWGPLAQRAKEQVPKGSKIAIKGRLKTDEWVDKMTGAKRKAVRIVANSIDVVRTPKYMTGGDASQVFVPSTHSDSQLEPLMYSDQPLSAADLKWKAYFEHPGDWWDNRTTKKNPRAPDFKHKKTGDALWVDSRDTPDWVHQRFSGGPAKPTESTTWDEEDIPF